MKRRTHLLLMAFPVATLFIYRQDPAPEALSSLWAMDGAMVCTCLGFTLNVVLSVLLLRKTPKRRRWLLLGAFLAYCTLATLLSLCCGLPRVLYIIHMSYTYCFSAYITYLLLCSPQVAEREKKVQPARIEDYRTETPEEADADNEIKEYEMQLLSQLDKLMEIEKIYCSSELTLPELARLLGTNRTKLSEIIRLKGFSNFQAYVNSYRLQEFMRILSLSEFGKISDASSLAGFGSKASLYRCFTSAYGVSPSEYLKTKTTK